MARSFVRTSSMYLDASVLPVTAYPCSFACWFQPKVGFNNDPNGLLVLGQGTGSANSIGLIWQDTGGTNPTVAAFINNAGTLQQALHGTALALDTWYHAVAVFVSATDYSVFLNGANKASQNNSIAFPSSMDRVLIGSVFSASQRLTSAFVAEAGIWNVAITDGEAAILAQGFSPLMVRTNALKFYAPLLGNDSPEVNYHGPSLTLVNAPTKVDGVRIIRPKGVF